MTTKPLALPLLLLLLVSLAAVDAAGPGGRGPGPLVGGWNPISDVGTADIQKLGRWALGQAQQAGLVSPGLRFRRVVWGEQQVVAGFNYHLIVDVTDPKGRSTPYVANIFDPVGTSPSELRSFKSVACAY